MHWSNEHNKIISSVLLNNITVVHTSNPSFWFVTAKSSCSTLGCEYKCQASLTNGTCYCPDGRKLAPDNRTCIDKDECSEWGFCDQLCTNTDGGYQCSCASGYVLQSTMNRCVAKNSSGLELIFAHEKAVYRMDAQGRNVRIVANSSGASGLDFHFHKNRLFWSDPKTKSVSKYFLFYVGKDFLW